MEYLDKDGNFITTSEVRYTPPSTSTFTKQTITAVCGSTTRFLRIIPIYVYPSSTTGAAYVDSVTIDDASFTITNQLQNSNFIDGLAYWNINVSASVDFSTLYRNAPTVKIDVVGTFNYLYQYIVSKPGSSYRLDVPVYNSTGAAATIQLSFYDSGFNVISST